MKILTRATWTAYQHVFLTIAQSVTEMRFAIRRTCRTAR